MSSALLYLAIVGVWGGVLVPMWLRRETTAHGSRGRIFGRRRTTVTEPEDGAYDDDISDTAADGIVTDAETETMIDDGHAAPASRPTPDRRRDHAAMAAGPHDYATVSAAPRDQATVSAGPSDHATVPSGPRGHATVSAGRRSHAAARRRARIIARRRRRTTMLFTLLIASVTLAATHVAPWWTAAIPAVLLLGHLTLLRAAAAVDAQQSRAEAARERRRRATHAAEQTAIESTLTAPSAEIIDLAAHTREEIYDQYADAEKRAVND